MHSYIRERVCQACGDRNGFIDSVSGIIHDIQDHPMELELMMTVILVLARVMDSARVAGVKFTGDPRLLEASQERMFRLTKRLDYGVITSECLLLTLATKRLLDAGCGIEWPEEAQEQPIRIGLAGPLDVNVVSMPTRSTDTVITRDELGHISQTMQTERDADRLSCD